MAEPSGPKRMPMFIYYEDDEPTLLDNPPDHTSDLPKWHKPTAATGLSEHPFDSSKNEASATNPQRLGSSKGKTPVAMDAPDQYEAGLTDRLRLLRQQVPDDPRPKLPAGFLASLKAQIESSKKLLAWPPSRKHQQQQQQQHQHQQRRGASSPAAGASPPCVRCSVQNMPCSLTYEDRPDDIVSCTRCARNGVAHCIKQIVAGAGAGAGASSDGNDGSSSSSSSSSSSFLGGSSAGAKKYELAATLTPELVEAAEELLQGPLRDVCGMKMSADVCKGLVLPKWHDNDRLENMQDPDFRPRGWKEQLVDRRHEMLVAIQKKITVLEGQLATKEL